MWPCIVTNFFILKPTRCTNFTNLIWYETLHVSDSLSVHHQEFIHCTLSNGMCHTCCRQLSSRTRKELHYFHPGPARKLLTNPYDTYHCWVTVNKLLMMDKLSETWRVSCQNKFVKLVHLVGFITKKNRIVHLLVLIEFVLHFTMFNTKCLIGSELFAGYMRVALYRAISSTEQNHDNSQRVGFHSL
jgi:hypothetical protein